MLSSELLESQIKECKKQIDLGNEEEDRLEFLLKLQTKLTDATDSDWEFFNEVANHLPSSGDDQTLTVLKGQLLVERLIKRFVDSRLPNSAALNKQQFSAAQYIAIAESMCLNNDEPSWLWRQVKELNTIRNKLAHNLEADNIDKRISSFITTVCNAQTVHSRDMRGVVIKLCRMLNNLLRASRLDEFK